MMGSATDSVADASERDVVVDADFVQRNVDEVFMSEAGSAVEEETNPEEPVELIVPQGRPLRDALIAVDTWSLQELVSKRAAVMKNVPRVVKGPFRNAPICTGRGHSDGEVPPTTKMEIVSPSASHVVAQTSKRRTHLQREVWELFAQGDSGLSCWQQAQHVTNRQLWDDAGGAE